MQRVLLVDDEPRIMRFLELSLKLMGYEVVSTVSGRRAVELAETDRPDIILLDVHMPGGETALRKVRSFSNIPIIATSTVSGDSDRAMSVGATAYMPKPFNHDAVKAHIRALLGPESIAQPSA